MMPSSDIWLSKQSPVAKYYFYGFLRVVSRNCWAPAKPPVAETNPGGVP